MAQTKNVNMIPDNSFPRIYLSQYDVGREMSFKLCDGSVSYTVPTGATVKLKGTKPSGFGFTETCTVSGSTATISSTAGMTDEYGAIACELVVEKTGLILGSTNLLLIVEKSAHPEGTTDGSQETVIPTLTLLVERVEAAASSVLDMTVEAQTLAAGSDATYSYDEETNTATFGIPRGADGSLASGVLAPTYSSSATYAVGDYVYYSGNLYRCTTAITTAEAWTSGHWTQVALAPEVTDLKAEINDIETLFPAVDGFVFESGAISATGGTTDNNTRIRTKSGKLMQIKAGDCIYCDSAYKIRLGIFTANSIVQANFVGWITEWVNGVVAIPSLYDGKYVALTIQKVGSESADISADVLSVGDYIKYYSNKRGIENLATKEEIYTNDRVTIKNASKYYWNVETSVAVKTYIDGAFSASNPIAVTEGEVYILTARQGNTDKTRIWVVTDDDYNIIAMCENYKGTTEHTVQFTIPQDGTKLLLTRQSLSSNQSLYCVRSALDIIDVMKKEAKTLTGMKLSLLGDSISAYTGTIPSGNDAYYTGSNSGVSSADEMWWSVLCTETGMIPCVINGWSGSGVTQLEDSDHVNKVPMSSDARTSALHDGDDYPDIILISGGVNDYTYAKSAQSEPLPWDDQDTPVLGNSFTEAYACMIKKIQTNYPNAIVVGLSTWFTMRGTDNGYVLTHTSDSGNTYTQNDYNKAIEDVCYKMHIPFIRVDDIGMNRNNMYPTFAVDSQTIPTHPNAKGQMLMGEYLATQLPLVVNGYVKTI